MLPLLVSDGNEGVFRIPQSSKTEALPSDGFVPYPGHSLGVRVLPLCRDTVGVFYSPSQLSCSVLGWQTTQIQVSCAYILFLISMTLLSPITVLWVISEQRWNSSQSLLTNLSFYLTSKLSMIMWLLTFNESQVFIWPWSHHTSL